MELDQLKNAWNKFSDSDTNRHRVGEEELGRMLKRRTNGLLDRLDRNVRIGVGIIFALVLFFVLDDFFITPTFSEGMEVPFWIYFIDTLNTLFLLGTFVNFWLKHRRVKQSYSRSGDMRQVLQGSIRLLNTHRRLFSWALFVLLLVISVTFATGLFMGLDMAADRQGVEMEDLNPDQLLLTVARGLGVLVASVTLLFLLFRWGFRRLYGRYVKQLESTLAELEEIQ